MNSNESKAILAVGVLSAFSIFIPFAGLFFAAPALFFIAWMPYGDLWFTRMNAGFPTVMLFTFVLFAGYAYWVQRKRQEDEYWFHIPAFVIAVHGLLLTEVYLPIFWN